MGTITASVDPVEIDGVGSGLVGTLVIDNPARRNAMDAAMYLSIPDAVADLTRHVDLRCVVIRGAGDDTFSAGSDISEFPDRRMGTNGTKYHDAEHLAWNAIASIPVPVIASIHGPCRGGGVAIALHADLRIVSDDASFSVPPARLGIAYPMAATSRLVSLVGPAVAKHLLYTAEVLDAREALRVGLVQEVVPPADLTARIDELTHRIVGLAPLSIAAAKKTVDAIVGNRDDANSAIAACYASQDFREGVDAFLEKRRPHFRGR